MSKLKLAVVVGVTIGLVSVTGVLILVKNRFRPTTVHRWVTQAVNETLPGAEVTMSDLQLNFGLNLYVRLADIFLRTKEKKIELFDASSCVIKLPLWAILTGQGAVEVLVERPQVYYLGNGETNNWSIALHSSTSIPVRPIDIGVNGAISSSQEIHRPQFKFISKMLKRLLVNVKFGDLHVIYNLPENKRGKFHIEKFIIKGLNLESNTAFELASNVTLAVGSLGKAQFELLAIGQFNLADILFNSIVNTKTVMHLKNFVMPSDTLQIPEIKAEIDLSVDKKNNMRGPALISLGGSAFSANINGTIENPEFETLTVDVLMEDLANVTMLKHDKFSFGSSRIHVDGKVSVKDKKLFPELKFGLSAPITYKNESLKANIALSGTLHDGQYDLLSTVDVLGGSITSNVKGTLDINHLPDSAENYPPYYATIKANKLLIPKDILRNLGSKSVDEIDSSDPTPMIEKKKGTVKFPPGEMSISMTEIMTGVSPMSMEANVSIRPDLLNVKQAVVKYVNDDKGVLTFNSNIMCDTNQNILGKIKANFQGFNLQGLYPVFPKYVEGITGFFTGKVNAKFSSGKKWEYEVVTDVTAKNGEVRGINLKEQIFPILKKWNGLKGKETKTVSEFDDLDQHFEVLEVKGKFIDSEYLIHKFNFSGGPKRVSVKSNGVMYDQHLEKDGEFFLVLSDNKLKKYFSISTLPMRFFGKGILPTLDYEYTLEKLSTTIQK